MISLNKIFYGLFILMLVAGIYTYQLMWFKSSIAFSSFMCTGYIK